MAGRKLKSSFNSAINSNHLTNTAEIVFVRISVPLMIGIFCSYTIEDVRYLYIVLGITTILFLLLIGINIFYKTLGAYSYKNLIGLLFFFFLFAFGGSIALLNKSSLRQNYFATHSSKQLKVCITDEPQNGNGTVKFSADVIAAYVDKKFQQTTGKLLIIVYVDTLNPISYEYGDELLILADYTSIAPPFNPGEFDFKAWLSSKNINHQTLVRQNAAIKTGVNKGNPIIKYALTLRQEQIDYYRRIIKNNEAFAVASTLILGYRADLSDETLAAYSKTGTIHALSVSGMHVGIIYIVLNWALSFLDKNRSSRILKVILIGNLIWFYSLLTGFSPSVLRSAIMLSVYIVAKSFNKHTNGYNILTFTGLCLLIHNPFLIWDVGFQLSFIAVFGLIYLQPKIYKVFYFKYKIIDWLWSSVSLSLAAQIATFPLSIFYFHQFPVYFIFSNLFILLPITLLMYLGLSILLFKLYFLAPMFEWIIIFMNSGLNRIADLPFSGITQIWLNKVELSLLILALIFGVIAITERKKHSLLCAIICLLFFHLSLKIQQMQHSRMQKIIFFTLQKGFAVAFINRQQAIIVSDLLSDDQRFKFFIQPALDQIRIKNNSFLKWNEDLNLKFFKKKHHQINFFNYNILLVDSSLNRKTIAKTPKFNIIWLHQNPKISLKELQKQVIFTSIVMDASNNNFNIEHYKNEAKKIKIQANVLKKNKAYLIDLNHKP